MTSVHKAALLQMLVRKSFRLEQTSLSAGGTSDYYIDCRTTTLSGRGGRLAGAAILDLIREKGLSPSAVGGMTLGADPVVSNVTAASAWQADQTGIPVLDGFLLRKEKKAHGAGRRIEGFCEPGAEVVIVDDACTTGAHCRDLRRARSGDASHRCHLPRRTRRSRRPPGSGSRSPRSAVLPHISCGGGPRRPPWIVRHLNPR